MKSFRAILLLIITVLAGFAAHASLTGPGDLPPYEYVHDGDFRKSCRLFLAKKTPQTEWYLCKRSLQGFIDAKLASDKDHSNYCIPDDFSIETAIESYVNRFDLVRSTSLYYEATPASRFVNTWFEEQFACK